MRLAALLLALLVACAPEHVNGETGVLLLVEASASVRSQVVALRVLVHSGDPGTNKAAWPERGDETVDAGEWPAEVFVRATDPQREWFASVWGLAEDGAPVAFGQGGGAFAEGAVRRWAVMLEPCADCVQNADAASGGDIEAGADDVDAAASPHYENGDDAGTQHDATVDAAIAVDSAMARDASFEAAAPHDAYAPSDDASLNAQDTGPACDPTSCTNTCFLSTAAKCCRPDDTCGCAISGGSMCL